MAFLFEGIAKAILYVIPPLFEVDIDTRDTDGHTIAGRLTKICTITIQFPDYSNFWQKDPRTEIDSLRPTVDLENSNSAHLPEDDVDLILGEDHWVSDEKNAKHYGNVECSYMPAMTLLRHKIVKWREALVSRWDSNSDYGYTSNKESHSQENDTWSEMTNHPS